MVETALRTDYLADKYSSNPKASAMSKYNVEVRLDGTVIRSIPNQEFSDQNKAWDFLLDLSYHFETPGIRFVVKDQNGGAWLMAGLTSLQTGKKSEAA